MWQNEFKNKESKKFKELSGQIEREFSDHSSFNQSREILNWHVSRLQQNKSEVIINLRVRTTAHMSPDQLLTMVLESNMNNTVIDAKELYFATTSIFPESSTLFLAHLSSSVILQTSLQTLDAPTTQTTSPMSTTPRWTTTHFSLKTASAMSLISPSFSEKFMTSSEVHVIEKDPATEDLAEIVPTEKSPIKTQPTVPESCIKFVVSMKVGSYNYIPEMEDLSSSVNLQTSSQTLDVPTTQTTSPMSTTPRWTTTHFSLKTASAMSLISPSFSEKFMTSSEVHVIEKDPATEDLAEIVPTEKSPIKTQPTVPESCIKFVVSMKVGSYNYIPEMEDLSSSVNLQTSSQTLDAPTTQTTSPMLTIPRWTTTHFSLKTASAMSLISPSFSEKFMTSSEVYVIEEKPATEEITEIVPTEKSPSKTQPTVPESSIKFVVSKKVGSYNYIPEMEDLSSSVNLQTSSQTLDAPTTQTTSPMLTIPRWTTTHFSLKTASAMSLISPSFSEKFMTSSEVYVIEEKPATEELTEIVPTEKSPSKTQPTVLESSIKFVVSMKVGSYNFTPEMENPESAVFKKVAKEIGDALYEELCLKKLLDCISVEVFKLEKGSVIVSYNVHMASSTNYKQSHVNNVITDSANSGQLGRLKVSDVEVKKGDKEEEQNDSSSSRVFVYVLCGVGALLVIASIIAATSKVRKRTICCHPI